MRRRHILKFAEMMESLRILVSSYFFFCLFESRRIMHSMSLPGTALTDTQHSSRYDGAVTGPFFLMYSLQCNTMSAFCCSVHGPLAATGSSDIVAHTRTKRSANFAGNMVLISQPVRSLVVGFVRILIFCPKLVACLLLYIGN